MAVLKQTSPTAWPSAPRPKPSSTVPSASTSSAVGLWSGQAASFSVVVMSALHIRRRLRGQSRNFRIHMRSRIFDTLRRRPNLWLQLEVDFPSKDYPDQEPSMENAMPILLVPGLVSSARIYV